MDASQLPNGEHLLLCLHNTYITIPLACPGPSGRR